MSSNNSGTSGGIGFAGALTLLFIGLRLGKVIDWSWWWVLSPAWISIGLALLIALGLALVAAVGAVRDKRRSDPFRGWR